MRTLSFFLLLSICLAAAPSVFWAPRATTPLATETATGPTTPEELVELFRTEPVKALEAIHARVQAEVRGFRATLHKQERLGKTLGPQEVIQVSCRNEEPFAVRMVWKEGATKLRSPVETLLVRGENQGKMRVKLKLGLTVPADPNSSEARATSRYSLADMGFAPAT
ncbi:MAG: DUF1571 domain-containing protein, partial [Gemmataceae bacterium]